MAVTHAELAELAGAVLSRPATRAEQRSPAGCVLAQAEHVASYTKIKRKGAALKRRFRKVVHEDVLSEAQLIAEVDSLVGALVALSRPADAR